MQNAGGKSTLKKNWVDFAEYLARLTDHRACSFRGTHSPRSMRIRRRMDAALEALESLGSHPLTQPAGDALTDHAGSDSRRA